MTCPAQIITATGCSPWRVLSPILNILHFNSLNPHSNPDAWRNPCLHFTGDRLRPRTVPGQQAVGGEEAVSDVLHCSALPCPLYLPDAEVFKAVLTPSSLYTDLPSVLVPYPLLPYARGPSA